MSITITGEFKTPYDARQAAERLRRRGYIVSSDRRPAAPLIGDKLLVAYPFGATGGNTIGNSILGAMPPMAVNSISAPSGGALVSVLTDDTQSSDAVRLMESLGGRIL